jgi:hypothetical protein
MKIVEPLELGASEVTEVNVGSPLFSELQFPPPFVLLNKPPPALPA